MSTSNDTPSPLPESPGRPPRAWQSRGRIALSSTVLAIGALGAVAYAVHWWNIGRFHEQTDDAYVGGDVTSIGTKVPGYIAELVVTDNQFVHAGDLLARIDVRDYQADLQKAGGAVAAQQAALANLRATATLQQALIAKAQAGVDAAVAEEARAREDFLRHQDLVRRSAVSLEAAQRADSTEKAAVASLARARAEVLAAQRQLDVIATQRLQAEAALEQASATQKMAQLNVGYTEIRAPRDGFVGNRKARVGAYVSPGTVLLSIVPAQGLWIDANFKEDQLHRMQVGQAVRLRADAWPDMVLHGHLASLAPATGAQFSVLPAENATGNFTKIVQRVPVRIELDPADDKLGRLRPGLSVVVDVDTASSGTGMALKTASQP